MAEMVRSISAAIVLLFLLLMFVAVVGVVALVLLTGGGAPVSHHDCFVPLILLALMLNQYCRDRGR